MLYILVGGSVVRWFGGSDTILITSSAITFLSFDSLGEKYVLLMSNLKVHLFSL